MRTNINTNENGITAMLVEPFKVPKNKDSAAEADLYEVSTEKCHLDELFHIVDAITMDIGETAHTNLEFEKLTEEEKLERDVINTGDYIRQVFRMYLDAFREIGIDESDRNDNDNYDFLKQWGKPLSIYLYSLEGIKARYTSGGNFIDFGVKGKVKVCRFFDIVTHEVGHSVFQAMMHPKGSNRNPFYNSEMAESFSDLTAIFTSLSQKETCRALIYKTKGDLRSHKNSLPRIGEQFAIENERYETKYVRNLSTASDHITCGEESTSPYELSMKFSRGVYEIILRTFEEEKEEMVGKANVDDYQNQLAESLHKIGSTILQIILKAFYKVRKVEELDFYIVLGSISGIIKEDEYRDYEIFFNEFIHGLMENA